LTRINNKIDLLDLSPCLEESGPVAEISLSAKTGQGVDLLRRHLKNRVGFQEGVEDGFIARRRHLDALDRAGTALLTGQRILNESGAGELLAEDLRQAQNALSEITGAFTPDDLLGRIFSEFCIGK
jgi:tRNA modification GTPase